MTTICVCVFYFVLFVYTDAISSSYCIASNDWVIWDLEEMRKEASVAEFEILFRNLCGGTEETTEFL
jgi:hypothetical protein